MDEHLKIPLIIALLIFLWTEKDCEAGGSAIVESITTATQLYFRVNQLIKKKLEMRRRNSVGRNLNKDEIEIRFSKICKQAYKNLREGTLCFTESCMKDLPYSDEIDKNDWLAAFFKIKPFPEESSTHSFFHR